MGAARTNPERVESPIKRAVAPLLLLILVAILAAWRDGSCRPAPPEPIPAATATTGAE